MGRHLRSHSGVLRVRVHGVQLLHLLRHRRGFITYCIVKTCKKQAKDVHPVIWVVAVLFILDFIITAVL